MWFNLLATEITEATEKILTPDTILLRFRPALYRRMGKFSDFKVAQSFLIDHLCTQANGDSEVFSVNSVFSVAKKGCKT